MSQARLRVGRWGFGVLLPSWLSATAALISDEASEIAVEGATAFWSNGAKPNSNSNAKKSDKKKGDCRWCGKPGHWEAECRQKAAGKPRTEKPNNKNNSQNGGTTASNSFSMKARVDQALWALDTGTTNIR